MKNFALIGAAGYIAPRHLKAIKETGNTLVAAMDITDSVGIMDSFFPDAEFFTEFEQFEEFIEDLLMTGTRVDYIAICSPNYLHAPHMKFALKKGINVICEKPLVLTCAELDALSDYEAKYGGKVNSILQLRLHPAIKNLQAMVNQSRDDEVFNVDLTYLTSRGNWYLKSWKGNHIKSGGVATNIGVHFYDMLGYVFGDVKHSELHFSDEQTVAGYLEFERARVRWFLSIDANYLPDNAVVGEKLTYRSIVINGEELEFSGGFTDLHTASYENVLAGNGFGLEENRSAIEVVENIRRGEITEVASHKHPYLTKVGK